MNSALVGIIGAVIVALQTAMLAELRELRRMYADQEVRFGKLAERVAKLEP